MDIAALVDQLAMEQIGLHGCVKGLDPYALHLLKTSRDPLLVMRRTWMRETALRQCLAAEKRQRIINDRFKDEPFNPRSSLRRQAVIDPYYMADMARRHKASWGDRDFIGSVREANPAIFPRRR